MIGLAALLCSVGCQSDRGRAERGGYQTPPPPDPLGTYSDPLWRMQEDNAEQSDFVMYQHEFRMNQPVLNAAGQDHLKEIAHRIQCGQDLPVLIEMSDTYIEPDSEYQYPVNRNPQLDDHRRELVARTLYAMGVEDAHHRVVVSHRYSAGMDAMEAATAYESSLGRGNGGYSGGQGSWGGGGYGW